MQAMWILSYILLSDIIDGYETLLMSSQRFLGILKEKKLFMTKRTKIAN